MEENNVNVICRSNCLDNNRNLSDSHSSTNSQYQTNWSNQQQQIYHKDSPDSILITVEEEKASILEHFFQQNPFADFSQLDEIIQRTQLDEQVIRVTNLLFLFLNAKSSSLFRLLFSIILIVYETINGQIKRHIIHRILMKFILLNRIQI